MIATGKGGLVGCNQEADMQKKTVIEPVEDKRLEVAIAALGESIARCTEAGEQHTTAVPGLSLFRREEPTEPITGMYEPTRGARRTKWRWCPTRNAMNRIRPAV